MFKILLVEDDKFIATILSFFIKNIGHQLVERCSSGKEALELCKKHNPDIVLMDIHLEGDMDGIQTAERIQRDNEIPVIFISSDTSENVVERAIVTNSYGYLIKPIQKRELAITIDLAYYKHKSAMDQKRREQGYRQFISGAAAPIIIISDGNIRYLNMNALDLLHSHYIEDIMGLPFLNFVNEIEKKDFQKIFDMKPQPGLSIPRFRASIKGLHGKNIDVAVCGSWITFNNSDALQLIMFDVTEEKKTLADLNLYGKILKDGMGAYFEMNNVFEITDYNETFQNLVSSAIEIKGNSLFNLKPFLEIDNGILADNIKNKDITEFDLELKTTFLKMNCRAYIFRDKESNVEKVVVSALEIIYT